MALPTQGTPEWKQWKHSRIGASESSAILGISPWKTALKLYLEKKSALEDRPTPPHMQRGLDLEPMARKLLEQETGLSFIPTVLEHQEHKWLIASLDGITFDGQVLCEIKCANKAVIDLARSGRLPDYYMCQVQHQLLVSGAEYCWYCCFDGNDIYPVKVLPQIQWQSRILSECTEFYDRLQSGEPPAFSEKDYVPISSLEAEYAAKNWASAKKDLDLASKQEKAAREKLLCFADDGNFVVGQEIESCPTVKATRVSRNGSVDWKHVWEKACKLHPDLEIEISLEDYRSQQVGYYKLEASND